MKSRSLVVALVLLLASPVCLASDEDPYFWLEEVENEKALAWAEKRSDQDVAVLEAVPDFSEKYH